MSEKISAAEIAEQPLLTIAIPTYQRFKWLSQSLEIILGQLNSTPRGQIELLVAENAGTDGSWAHLQTLAAAHPELRIHRNVSNIGGEANFHQLPGMARGKYLWLLGDDDFLEPGALAAVLDLLSKKPDYVAVNALMCDEQMQGIGKPFWSIKNTKPVGSFAECTDIIPHFAMGFIASWVARRESFNKVDHATYERFKQWGLSLMLDRYLTVASSQTGWITAQPLIRSRKPPPAEYGNNFDYFEWFFEGTAQVFQYLENHGLIDRHAVAKRKGWLLQHVALKRILFERYAGILNRKRVTEILANHYSEHWQYWLLCLPALFTPGLGAVIRLLRRA